jgi:hypothetical protein
MANQDDYSINWQRNSNYAKFWRTIERTHLAVYLLEAEPGAELARQEKVCNLVMQSGDVFRPYLSQAHGRIVIEDGPAFSTKFVLVVRTWALNYGVDFAIKLLEHIADKKFGIIMDKILQGYLREKLELGDLAACDRAFANNVLKKSKKVIVLGFKWN